MGKLVDCEPSRFLEEIDEEFVEYQTPKRVKPAKNRFVDLSIFDDTPQKIRFQKPTQRKHQKHKQIKKSNDAPPKNLKKIIQSTAKVNLFDNNIVVGNLVEHNRFGEGEVIALEGSGANKKAEIQFRTAGKKKLLLQYAKLKIIG